MAEELVDFKKFPDRVGETFNNKTVFITGGTGYIGKGLIEKILHNSRVKKIYVLIKDKRGQDAHKRFANYFDRVFFDSLKTDCGVEVLKKVSAISGDVSQLDLGISREDRLKLIQEVDLMYHGAASVRFDESLKKIILNNVRGTRYMIDLAKEINNLQLFVHISTTYCLPANEILEEAPIEPPYNPHEMIRIAENVDDGALNILTQKLLNKYGNTYGYSKALSEGIINEQIGKLPVMIVRPSIIMPVWKMPIPGYVDSVNGPTGFYIASGKAMLRVGPTSFDVKNDMIPLDLVINVIMITSYNYINETNKKVMVCNATSWTMTHGEMSDETFRVLNKIPLDCSVWYPFLIRTKCPILYYFYFLVLQLIPALFIDMLLVLFRKKRFMVKIQQKLFRTLNIVNYYSDREWNFKNDTIRQLTMNLNLREDGTYPLNIEELDLYTYCIGAVLSGRRFILHEKDEDIPLAIRRHKQLYYVHTLTKGILAYFFVKFAYGTLLPLAIRLSVYIFDV